MNDNSTKYSFPNLLYVLLNFFFFQIFIQKIFLYVEQQRLAIYLSTWNNLEIL